MTHLSDEKDRRPTGPSKGARVPPTLGLGFGGGRAPASTARVDGEDCTVSGGDVFGALASVEVPQGPRVQSVHDPLGRRIARYEDGVRAAMRPVADLNAADEVTSVFAYRFVTDHLGSARVVVRMSDGEVVERTGSGAAIDPMSPPQRGTCRDAPFGFAGGLHDWVTGLVHFGARDCDPVTGRWMQKDPIRFAGGDTNILLPNARGRDMGDNGDINADEVYNARPLETSVESRDWDFDDLPNCEDVSPVNSSQNAQTRVAQAAVLTVGMAFFPHDGPEPYIIRMAWHYPGGNDGQAHGW